MGKQERKKGKEKINKLKAEKERIKFIRSVHPQVGASASGHKFHYLNDIDLIYPNFIFFSFFFSFLSTHPCMDLIIIHSGWLIINTSLHFL